MTAKCTWVRKTWTSYSKDIVSDFNLQVQRDLGRLNSTWGFSIQPMDQYLEGAQPMVIDYWFEDPHDATVFALKYLGP